MPVKMDVMKENHRNLDNARIAITKANKFCVFEAGCKNFKGAQPFWYSC